MNKPDWFNDISYFCFLENYVDYNKVKPICKSLNNPDNYNNKDRYNKRESKNYYGKKRRCYADYC